MVRRVAFEFNVAENSVLEEFDSLLRSSNNSTCLEERNFRFYFLNQLIYIPITSLININVSFFLFFFFYHDRA